MDKTLEKLQNQWNSEGVTILVLTSLSIQISLMFNAPLRKRNTNKVLALTIWLLYLTAELVPTLAVGNMGKQIDPADSGDNGTMPGDLNVLWAAFLLLHLGGPDAITSYSIDDNQLWWRLPLGLVIQVGAAAYAFWQSPPNPVLWIPTILVCIAGMIKFVERTLALRLGSKDNLKDKIISEFRLEDEYSKEYLRDFLRSTRKGKREIDRKIEDNLEDKSISEHGASPENETEVELSRENESERESQIICEAYVWFDIFRRLLVDVTFSSNLLIHCRNRFSDLSAKDAFNLVAIELSFMYDILHTKAVHLNCNLGRVLRCFSLVPIIAALIVFHHLDKQKYASKDIIITYILFGASLTLEVAAALLLVSSDWTVVALRKKGWRKLIARAITKMVKQITFMKGNTRWSKTMGQYNLIGLCLRDRDTLLAKIMRIRIKWKYIWDVIREKRSIHLPEMLEDYMFIEAIRRTQNIDIYNVFLQARSYRGSKALKDHGQLETLGWSIQKEFDKCIILWHLATDICYYKDTSGRPNKENESDCIVSWTTSNYMAYLLIHQQSMMQVGYGMKKFEAACAVVKRKFKARMKGKGKLEDKNAREELLEEVKVAQVLPPVLEHAQEPADGRQPTDKKVTFVLKKIWAYLRSWGRRKREEDKRKLMNEDEIGILVLKDGLRLADELQKVDQQIRWKLIRETWMEMLGYAAIHCDSYEHAKSLSRGGELLTHFWLLLSHMGMVEEHKMLQSENESV